MAAIQLTNQILPLTRIAKTGADVRVRTSAEANINPCLPQESRQQSDGHKNGRMHVPMPICLFKIAQILKSGFPYTNGIINQAV
jgi:hypothetical protein